MSNAALSKLLRLPINTVTPRVLELRQLGLVVEAYQDSDGITGRKCSDLEGGFMISLVDSKLTSKLTVNLARLDSSLVDFFLLDCQHYCQLTQEG